MLDTHEVGDRPCWELCHTKAGLPTRRRVPRNSGVRRRREVEARCGCRCLPQRGTGRSEKVDAEVIRDTPYGRRQATSPLRYAVAPSRHIQRLTECDRIECAQEQGTAAMKSPGEERACNRQPALRASSQCMPGRADSGPQDVARRHTRQTNPPCSKRSVRKAHLGDRDNHVLRTHRGEDGCHWTRRAYLRQDRRIT